MSLRTRRRLARAHTDDEAPDVVIADQQPGACIDLTADSSIDEGVIDLTSLQSIMDSPVVVLSAADDLRGPTRNHTRRGSGRLGRRRSRSLLNGVGITYTDRQGNRRTRSGTEEVNISDSDEELPDIHTLLFPSDKPSTSRVTNMMSPLSSGSSKSTVQSPDSVAITCPICLDDVKQIRRSKRQVMSTICGHIFCDECIKTAIRTQHSCPSCRKKLNNKNIHPLFL